MGRKTATTSAASLVLAALVCVPAVAAPAPAAAADPVRVLITGDSGTQGAEGDWTWRYRLWKHLAATATTPVDFVGPRTDLYDYLTKGYGNHSYVDPDFDQDHAARAGLSLAYPEVPMAQLVEDEQADVVVEMLGIIDLTYYQETPGQVKVQVEKLVTDARSANPDVDVVVGEISQTWFPNVPETNALLADLVASLDQPGSRVLLAELGPSYSEAVTYDGAHPDAQGEVMIAGGVADALAELGIGTAPARPLPVVPLGPRIPSRLTGALTDGRAQLTWVRSPGADSTQVSARDVTAGEPWTVVADRVEGTTWRSGRLPIGHRVEFRVLPRKSRELALPDIASNAVSVARPRLPARPRLRATTRAKGATLVTWRAAARADSYTVELRMLGRRGWRDVAVGRSRTRLLLRGLRSGATYAVRVTAVNTSGPSPTSRPVRFTTP